MRKDGENSYCSMQRGEEWFSFKSLVIRACEAVLSSGHPKNL